MSAELTTQARPGANTGPGPTELVVSGMSCSNCVRHVTEAIQGVPGVRSAQVVLDAGRASVRWAGDAAADVPAVLAAVRAAGYEAKPLTAPAHDPGTHHRSGWQINLWIGLLGTVPLMVGEWVFGLGMARWFQWFSFALAGMVQSIAGAPFYRGAWRQLRNGSSNMDTLVALGSTAAFGYSTWALFAGIRPAAAAPAGGPAEHVYFMEAAAIITLISVGHWLESRVSERAAGSLRALMRLAPRTARRLDAPRGRQGEETGDSFAERNKRLLAPGVGVEKEVPVGELNPGDLVMLRPGDHTPTDGVVVEGESAVDESMLTGESMPVDKRAGSDLYAGTLSLNGWLVMRVTATGEATALAHIVAAVQRAQTSRAHIQRLGDRVSNVFVPVVVLVACAAGVWWGLAPAPARQMHQWLGQFLWDAHPPAGALAAAFIVAAAVLIIACPCAMGLATPAAIMAGANAAARRGILIRDGVALEKAGKVTAVLFDKTGTLTVGRPAVARVWEAPREGAGNAEPDHQAGTRPAWRSLAALLAQPSTHPVSQAVAKWAAEGGDPRRPDREEKSGVQPGSLVEALSRWQEVRGAGVQAGVHHSAPGMKGSERLGRLGSLAWLRDSGVGLSGGQDFIGEWSAQGATIVGLALDQSLAALFAVQDTLKPSAGEVVGELRRQGLKTCLLTGDNARTANGIAQQVGIAPENVFAEVRPEQKAEFVKDLQRRGERVAFVGDGINDAPALEQADLGIAVSRASDVARKAADIILLNSEIEAVPEALGLARATLRTIKQNLFWAFFYNALGVPLAALGFLSPILCAAAMGGSDLVVLGNALRLRRWRPGSRS